MGVKKKSKHKAEELEEFIEDIAEISCSVKGCSESDSTFCHYDSSQYFFKAGWRATENNVYCPKHAKAKLKNI